uniref:Uncharacterized protein n=1 Tax=Clastoptera arizonana TaxID=38151 RepID=A0A1B6C8F9_9HEMI
MIKIQFILFVPFIFCEVHWDLLMKYKINKAWYDAVDVCKEAYGKIALTRDYNVEFEQYEKIIGAEKKVLLLVLEMCEKFKYYQLEYLIPKIKSRLKLIEDLKLYVNPNEVEIEKAYRLRDVVEKIHELRYNFHKENILLQWYDAPYRDWRARDEKEMIAEIKSLGNDTHSNTFPQKRYSGIIEAWPWS